MHSVSSTINTQENKIPEELHPEAVSIIQSATLETCKEVYAFSMEFKISIETTMQQVTAVNYGMLCQKYKINNNNNDDDNDSNKTRLKSCFHRNGEKLLTKLCNQFWKNLVEIFRQQPGDLFYKCYFEPHVMGKIETNITLKWREAGKEVIKEFCKSLDEGELEGFTILKSLQRKMTFYGRKK